MVATSEILVSDPSRYRNHKAWWTAVHRALQRAGNGAQAALAARAGCSGGHLHNVLNQVKPLNAPLDRTLPLALGLAADALAPDRSPELCGQLDGRVLLDGQDLLPTLAALSAFSPESLTPAGVAGLCWPGTSARIASRALAQLRGDEPACTVRPLSRVGAEERPALVRQLREAALALLTLEGQDRRILAGCWAAPEGAVAALESEVSQFQARWMEIALQDLRGPGPFRVARIGLQITPLGLPVTPDSQLDTLTPSAPEPAPPEPHAAPAQDLFSVFAYRDIVPLTEAWLEWKQRQQRYSVYSWRWLADRLGCGPSDLTLIRRGARAFGLQRAEVLVRLAGWTGEEAEMVRLLGRLSEVRTGTERGDLLAAMFRLEGYRRACTLEERSSHATMDLPHLLLFERCAMPGGLQDAATGAQDLALGLSEQEVRGVLDTLASCGLVTEDADGRWRLAWREHLRLVERDRLRITALDPSERPTLTRLHIIVLDAIAARLGQDGAAASLTLPIAEHRWTELRDAARDLRNSIGGLLDQRRVGPSMDRWRLYLFTTQFHALTALPGSDDAQT